MDEAKFANDFEERHGWSPDIGYEVIEPKPKKKKKEPKLTPKQEKFGEPSKPIKEILEERDGRGSN